MMVLLLFMINMGFFSGEFSGVFLYLVMFYFFLFNCMSFGLDSVKGDLFGVLGLDYMSFYMLLLMLWVMSVVLIMFYSWFLYVLVLGLLLGMSVVFCSLDLLYLFIYFEFSMIPMFMIILFMGGYKERYLAGMYMFIYTMVSSLPMLMMLLIFYSLGGGMLFDYGFYNQFFFDIGFQVVIMLMFLVKVPMFLVHVWLPKAHVESPVFGSMILASIMLKMGGYGVIRCLDLMEVSVFLSDFFFCLCLCGGVFISYFCLYQSDLKILVAYSSIIHMGIVLMGIFSGSDAGYIGGLIMMMSHGICSSGMFYLVNEVYKITGSRLLILNKGLISVMPMLGWFWLIMLINNLGIPPCFGILGEIFLIIGCLSYFFCVFIFFFFVVFFISCFVINMYSLLVGGEFMLRFISVSVMTYFGGVVHFIPLNFFVFFIGNCL